MLSGCDMFRSMAGKPTSKELEARRIELIAAAKAQIAEQEAMDSVQVADSVAIEEVEVEAVQADHEEISNIGAEEAPVAIDESAPGIKSLDKVNQLYSDELTAKYYIILGSYKDNDNLEAMLKKVSAAGYIPVKIPRENGSYSVGIESGSSMYEAKLDLRAVRRESFCPRDAWIMVNKAVK